MQITCPSCHAQFDLAAALNVDAARSALLTALKMPAEIAVPLARYLGLFNPPQRKGAFSKLERLMQELLPMLQQGVVHRNGQSVAAPIGVWRDALEDLINQASAGGSLRLPLKTNGYLLEIVISRARDTAAAAEREREALLRAGVRSEPTQTAAKPRTTDDTKREHVTGLLQLGIDRDKVCQMSGATRELVDQLAQSLRIK